jgi:YidC/Oxa1 family membrane protein insertase
MERRLLLVFALTFVIILAVQPLLMKKFAPPQQSTPEAQKTTVAPAVAPDQSAGQPSGQSSGQKTSAAVGTTQARSESSTVIENDLYRIEFTNRGAQVKSWVLKKFTDDNERPLDLVNSLAAAKYGLPLSLWTYNEALRSKLNSALYVPSSTGTQPAPAELVFEYAEPDLVVRKSFRFDHTYVVKVEASVVYNGTQTPAYPAWPAGFGDQTVPSSYAAARIDWQHGDKIERTAAKKISGGATVAGPFQWAGVIDPYFCAVFMPENPETAAMVTLRNEIEIPKTPQKPDVKEKVEVLGTAVGNSKGPTVERVFVGPKTLEVVESVHVGNGDLRGVVNFGFFGIIARPLFLWLRWMHEHIVRNWGWAIALQTLIINLALLPLRISSMKSSLKMQKVAPQIKAIQEKYKKYSIKDPRRAQMNQEVGALYKKEGVNPVGGCVPLIIQMPFLFAYYSMLGAAIELRHAPWLWVHDLASPDPWHLLPIGIIITTLLVQQMTPTGGMDPTQQRMMTFMMPVMLGFISWNLASGLCLYWSMGNAISIVQQIVMNRTELGREMRAEMEKRARKKAKA